MRTADCPRPAEWADVAHTRFPSFISPTEHNISLLASLNLRIVATRFSAKAASTYLVLNLDSTARIDPPNLLQPDLGGGPFIGLLPDAPHGIHDKHQTPKVAMKLTRAISTTNFLVASSALAFQVFVLYPWHKQLEDDFEALKQEHIRVLRTIEQTSRMKATLAPVQKRKGIVERVRELALAHW